MKNVYIEVNAYMYVCMHMYACVCICMHICVCVYHKYGPLKKARNHSIRLCEKACGQT